MINSYYYTLKTLLSDTVIKSACIYAQTKRLVQKGHQKVKKCKFTARFSYQIEFWDEKKQQDATELTKTKNPLRTFLQPIFFFSNFFGTKHEHRKRIST